MWFTPAYIRCWTSTPRPPPVGYPPAPTSPQCLRQANPLRWLVVWRGKRGRTWKNRADLHIVYYYPVNLHFVGISWCMSFLFAGSWAPMQKKNESEAAEMERPKKSSKSSPNGLDWGILFFLQGSSLNSSDVVTLENYGKLKFWTAKNGGLLEMMFLFNWVIFRFQPLIFRGVVTLGMWFRPLWIRIISHWQQKGWALYTSQLGAADLDSGWFKYHVFV